jgi:L-threonylcarbamoyladenylate synthase
MGESIAFFVQQLRSGGVVGMPTETVYGLAADATSRDAVAHVFALKGRPATNPLIVHVASIDVAKRFVHWDDRATTLFDRFAPGPISVVLPKRSDGGVCDLVTAGKSTVAIRIPNHPLALELLRAFDGALAAPSANRSNYVSPTSADHVRAEFGDSVPVLDGGPCMVGIESTVLDLTTSPQPTILRPGHITRSQIASVIGPVDVFVGHVKTDVAANSPGQHAKHYAPRSRAVRFGARSREAIPAGAVELHLPADPTEAARVFYARLREIDASGPECIAIELPPDAPEWAALRDRILRATVAV